VLRDCETWWRRAVSGEASGLGAALSRAFLAAASQAYLLGLKANLALYETGLLPRRKPALPTVSIGNLTLGGTGKTTTTRRLARRLLEEGVRPGIVLRGYRRRGGPAVAVVSDCEGTLVSAEQAGDEALMLAATAPGCAIAVGKRREAVVSLLAESTCAQVALLDDGFQYFRMQRIVDLVLLDATFELSSAKLFPAGYLREPLSHVRRATHILLTHSDLAPRAQLETMTEILRKHNPTAPIMRSRHVPAALYELGRPEAVLELAELQGLSAMPVSAIGNPSSFGAALMELGARVPEQLTFADHHDYSASDWDRVREAAQAHSPDCIVVTEKDAVKLPPAPPDLPPALVLAVDLEITDGEEAWEALIASVKSAREEEPSA